MGGKLGEDVCPVSGGLVGGGSGCGGCCCGRGGFLACILCCCVGRWVFTFLVCYCVLFEVGVEIDFPMSLCTELDIVDTNICKCDYGQNE